MTQIKQGHLGKKEVRPLVPFLKWAGGKRWLIDDYSHLLPDSFDTYIEPFLGSGAVFFALRPRSSVLSDLNQELIETYCSIRKSPLDVYKSLSVHHKAHTFDHYYKIRGANPSDPIKKAARFIYLNRTCFNGIYRVNLKGFFNVPIGSKTDVLLSTDDFKEASKSLRSAKIKCQDFEKTIGAATRNDFIFVDPPYTVAHNNNGFIKYNQTLFSWEDQLRLHSSLSKAASRGVSFLLLNANHQCLRDLYLGFKQKPLSRHSVIAASSRNRGLIQELAITNY